GCALAAGTGGPVRARGGEAQRLAARHPRRQVIRQRGIQMSSLRENLQEVQVAASVTRPAAVRDEVGAYRRIASDLHRELLDRIDLDVMGKLQPDRLREELRLLVERLIAEKGLALNA